MGGIYHFILIQTIRDKYNNGKFVNKITMCCYLWPVWKFREGGE